MKKNVIFIIIFSICIISMPDKSSALDFESMKTAYKYELPELYMTVEIPKYKEGHVFTRDDISNAWRIGISEKDMMSYLEDSHIYLDYVLLDSNCEIVIQKIEYKGSRKIYNFGNYSIEELKDIGEQITGMSKQEITDSLILGLGSQFENNTDIHFIQAGTAIRNEQKYITLDYLQETNDGDTVFKRQFYTIHNGQAINIILICPKEEFSYDISLIFLSIINSVSFTKTYSKPIISSFTSNSWFVGATVSLLLGLPILIVGLKKKKKQAHDSSIKQEDNTLSTTQSVETYEESTGKSNIILNHNFCRICGTPVKHKDSKYCTNCGTKIYTD